MKSRRYFLALLLLACVLPGSAHAFDAPSHRHYTEEAWQLYCDWLSPQGQEPAIELDALLEGTEVEDFIPFVTRLGHYHFYANNGTKNGRVFKRTSERRLNDLTDQLKQRLEKGLPCKRVDKDDNPSRIAGRILHHIQDMASPAHVVPVYHAKVMFLTDRPDSFELYAAAVRHYLPTRATTGHLTAAVAPSIGDSAKALYDNAAGKTQCRLTDVLPLEGIEGASGLTWAAFWQSREENNPDTHGKYPGFGVYGALGNNFGLPRIVVEKGTYHLAPRTYLDFYRRQHDLVIESTLSWLRLFDEALKASPHSFTRKPLQRPRHFPHW